MIKKLPICSYHEKHCIMVYNNHALCRVCIRQIFDTHQGKFEDLLMFRHKYGKNYMK
jgi:hypothetical protein